MNGARQHFEQMYQADPDPWQVASRWYERRKRDLLLAALPRERYAHGFEPGCGNGETTQRLLQRCERLCAVDFSARAVDLCRERMAPQDRARLRPALPRERYAHGFEPGCGNGEPPQRLLQRCERLCAVDFSARAVDLCRERMAPQDRARLDLQALPLPWQWPQVPQVPQAGFDLIVVSELAYYFDDAEIGRASCRERV